MPQDDDRIWFLGNPWPDGHRIRAFTWGGQLDPEAGLRFAFELTSEDYDADDAPEHQTEDEDDDDGPEDFASRPVWQNYHRCRITPSRGFVVGTPDEPLDFGRIAGRTFRVDRLEDVAALEDDDAAFHVYLLGHDSVADHRVRFAAGGSPLTFALAWDGRIALTYIGEEEFRHRFRVRVGQAVFQGFHVPDEIDDEAADRLFRACARDSARFRLCREDGERRYRPVL
ncbi:hypothetical protein DFP74_4833 [Nocardiopsis sp. Huas11]|uniref:hypothetical protein n=1 Tax=Nocardiopsis sp. Huas11 TaxID=2183912 RepID=UPI000EB1EAA0|nr:hypothetical protein [Nocardiopsis sp. Huas11]RKS09104.1 hypothetical protein DFP74_4833 [Nocardiopsis sp. Huas11]